jgi:hypothetical protein
MTVATYRPNGLAHSVLQMLQTGPASLSDLAQLVRRADRRRRRKVAFHALTNMVAHDLVDHAGTYFISPDGEAVLSRLEDGQTVDIKPHYLRRERCETLSTSMSANV